MIGSLDLAAAIDPVCMSKQAGIEPDPWQARLLRSGSSRILVNCSRQSGKALTLDTPIPTPDGWKTMGELAIGDEVFDEKGQVCYVLDCSPVMFHEAYQVSFSDGSTMIADADHLWTTLNAAARSCLSRTLGDIPRDWATWKGEGRPFARVKTDGPLCSFDGCEMVRRANGLCAGHNAQHKKGRVLTPLKHPHPQAKTLTTREMAETVSSCDRGDTNHSIPATQPLDLPEAYVPIDPYTLGAWLGDGHSDGARITAHSNDSAIIEEIAKAGYGCKRYERCSSTVPSWGISGLHKELRLMGLLKNKHIPLLYLRSSVAQRIALLQGLMDTDGCGPSERNQGTCEFTTTSERLAHDVYELMVSLGLIVRMRQSDAKLYGRVVSQKWRLFFCPWFVPFRLPRKVKTIKLDGPRKGLRKLRFILNVEPVGAREVKCISVSSPSQLYLAGRSMIPTHNSTTTATMAMHTALYEPDSPILLLSPSQRQSGELFRKCLEVYRALDRPVSARAENALSLELENNSRVMSLPGSEGTVRGISKVKTIIIDEASRVPLELYMAVRPMLAVSGGKLVLMSTPHGTQGFFYEAWLQRDRWDYYEVPATECPRISKEFLEEERENMGEWWFDQEYLCKFLDSENAAFRSQDIERIISKEEKVEQWIF
ncbi:MAG TPA: LAGLIDADG family homing endonuclease [Nitrososphaera sp.]|jgi:hypothetical protein|nr:LAGLIDADG family homing endonuclease [Nitrososphaera sp.]